MGIFDLKRSPKIFLMALVSPLSFKGVDVPATGTHEPQNYQDVTKDSDPNPKKPCKIFGRKDDKDDDRDVFA